MYGTEKKKKESHHHHNFLRSGGGLNPATAANHNRKSRSDLFPLLLLRSSSNETFYFASHTHSLPFPSFSFFRTAPPWQPAAARAMVGRWEKEGLSLRFERDLSLPPFSPSFLPGWLGWLAEGGGEEEEEGLPVLRTKLNRCCDSDPPVYTKKRKCLHCNENACLGDGCTSPPRRGWRREEKTNGFVRTQMETGISSPPPSAVCCRRQGKGPFPPKLEGGGEEKNLKTSTRST